MFLHYLNINEDNIGNPGQHKLFPCGMRTLVVLTPKHAYTIMTMMEDVIPESASFCFILSKFINIFFKIYPSYTICYGLRIYLYPLPF